MTTFRVAFSRPPVHAGLLQDDGASAAETAADASAGSRFSDEEIQQLFTGLAMAVQELEQQQRQSLRELQQVAVELAVAAAKWLTHAVVERNQFRVDDLIAACVTELAGNAGITVRLNPQDLELLSELQASAPDCAELPDSTQLRADPGLPRGSCRAESENISLVTDLDTRLTSVRQAWLESLDDAQTERRATGDGTWQPGRVPDRRETA